MFNKIRLCDSLISELLASFSLLSVNFVNGDWGLGTGDWGLGTWERGFYLTSYQLSVEIGDKEEGEDLGEVEDKLFIGNCSVFTVHCLLVTVQCLLFTAYW